MSDGMRIYSLTVTDHTARTTSTTVHGGHHEAVVALRDNFLPEFTGDLVRGERTVIQLVEAQGLEVDIAATFVPDPFVDLVYEKCRDCHLFVEPNHITEDERRAGIAEFVHLARGNPADDALEGSHNAVPSGMKANLATWKVYGPEAMRARFVTPARYTED